MFIMVIVTTKFCIFLVGSYIILYETIPISCFMRSYLHQTWQIRKVVTEAVNYSGSCNAPTALPSSSTFHFSSVRFQRVLDWSVIATLVVFFEAVNYFGISVTIYLGLTAQKTQICIKRWTLFRSLIAKNKDSS